MRRNGLVHIFKIAVRFELNVLRKNKSKVFNKVCLENGNIHYNNIFIKICACNLIHKNIPHPGAVD